MKNSLLALYKPIRRYSYLITSVLIVIALAYFLIWKQPGLWAVLVTVSAVLVILVLWAWLRPGPTEIKDAKQVYEAISNGRPTFLNIYSNY